MSRQQGGKGNRNVEASLAVQDVRNSIFGKYSEADMITELKRLAVDPCSPQFARDNIRPLWNQIIRLRTVMVLKDSVIPWRKRKLEQFVKDKLIAPSSFAVPDQQNITKSSSSSLLTFDDTLREKQAFRDCSSIVQWNCPNQDISPTLYSDESVNGSNPLSSQNPSPKDTNANHHLNSATLDGPYKRRIQSPRRSIIRRYVIPVGPRFQAGVPMWSGPVNRGEYNEDSDNSKWLGTRDWPIEIGNMKSTGRKIGKGRSNSCSCTSIGSVECIRRHILEERLLLQCDLGPAFFSWKFDEMGEQVSKSWTLKEQQTFESLLKKKPSSLKKDFPQLALKRISEKSRKDIVSYYFNVYIPQRMSLHTRSPSINLVDTDDEEEAKDYNNMGMRKRSKGKNLITSNYEDVKARYLRRPS
ncbi:hypothetical protein ACJIZ3_022122 [Penstemon smallii]|uniref:Uncharacterized protein n=1 Tax=Penstemon smallii TaxID=265156 RepID=A0ABD3SPE9_9LAMI